MRNKLFIVEKLTPDETDYSIAHIVPDFDTAVALCSRDTKMSISAWEYDEHLLRYNYIGQYDCNGKECDKW